MTLGHPTMETCEIYYYCPEDPFNDEAKKRILNNCFKNQNDNNNDSPRISLTRSTSSSSSASTSSDSSSCDEYEDSDTEFHAETSTRKIKRKILARDRDQAIDQLLKRRSLVLQRQSSNASCSNSSIKTVRFVDGEFTYETSHLNGKRCLSRQSSNCSTNSVSSQASLSSNVSCDISSSTIPSSSTMDTKVNYHHSVAKLAKQLRSNCDKILDMSVPFVIDSSLLWIISDAINELQTNNPNPDCIDEDILSQDDASSNASGVGSLGVNDDRTNYKHDCMFITDFFEQTPSLCIVLSEMSTVQGSIDITLFRSLQFLELRKIPVHMIAGINTIRVNLKKLKCTRCIDSLNEIFVFHGEHMNLQQLPSTSSSLSIPQQSKGNTSHVSFRISQQQSEPSTFSSLSTLTSVWPELREIDLSFNRIAHIDTKVLELIPSVEILNLSRNRISTIDTSFTRVLNCLTLLNLNYNQLTAIPPLPPNLKILLLSNNYISHLASSLLASNFKSLEILDLSQNVISDEQQLESFHHLGSLLSLALIGNPISYSNSYRSTISGNLNRTVLNNKQFVLDKKKLSNSEVRHAMEQIKKRRPLLLTGAAFLTPDLRFNSEAASRFSDIKSLTQSYDSNSSSVRSARRKKAKIREVVLLDDSDDENIENIATSSVIVKKNNNESKSSYQQTQHLRKVTLRRSDSTSSYTSMGPSSGDDSDERLPTTSVQDTKVAIESLREKYGAENWLLRQGGCEVKKLLGISDQYLKAKNRDDSDLFSKSLPPSASENTSFYSTVTNWEATASLDEANPHYGKSSHPSSRTVEDYVSSSSTIAGSAHSQSRLTVQEPHQNVSNDSIKVTDEPISSESSIFYYSCTNLDDNSKRADSNEPSDSEFDMFRSKQFDSNSPTFNFFQNGQVFKLIIEKQFLYEVNPNQSQNVISKWDLKSIKSMSQEKNNSETETVEFRLYFDTLKKHMKERTFYMTKSDYKNFEALLTPFLQKNTLEEFSDGFQCIKCNAQFTKCVITVKMIDKTPREVSVCPTCQSDLLIPLESIPLPNNASLQLDDVGTELNVESPKSERKSNWSYLPFCSTPASSNSGNCTGAPQSLPNSSIISDLFKSPLTSTHKPLTRTSKSNSNQMLAPSSPILTASKASSCSQHTLTSTNNNNNVCLANDNNGDQLATKCSNTKSDSDVEVLSCDSSSIEVLGKNDESGSDVEAEEAVEIFVPDSSGQLGKLSAITGPVMTESNSSGSFAESVCTTYELSYKKVIGSNTTSVVNLPQISHQLNQPMSPHMSISATTSSSSTSSATTLAPNQSNSSQTLNALMPIKYDYQDFTKIDHRLRLFCEITVFKSRDEELLALTKALVLGTGTPYLSVVIFSNKKIYFYKVTGIETEKPESWLQKKECFPLNKLVRLDVLIGRHGVGIDFQGGKYFALVFRDSKRTSNFFEFFLCDICAKIESPIVQDLSQTQKALLCSNMSTVSYFGLLRFSLCENSKKPYSVSAIVLTDDDLKILVDFSWLVNRTGNEAVVSSHEHPIKLVRQVECLEVDETFVRIVFQLEETKHVHWELCFETKEERDIFTNTLQLQIKDVPFISLSQPLEP